MEHNTNNENPPQTWKKDLYTLRVKGGNPNDPEENKRPTDPLGLSRSILHVLNNNEDGYVNLLSVGQTAMCIVMKAFRIAAKEVKGRSDAVALVNVQSEYVAEINNKKTIGVCTRIFPIPMKYKK